MMVLSRMIRARPSRAIVPDKHATPGNRPDPADLVGLLHQGTTQVDFAFFRLEQTFQGRLHVFGDLVNDLVTANLHAALFGQSPGVFVGNTLKPMMIASEASASVTSASVTPPTDRLQQLDLDFRMIQLAEFFLDRLDRTPHVGPQDDVQRLDLVGPFETVEQVSSVTCCTPPLSTTFRCDSLRASAIVRASAMSSST